MGHQKSKRHIPKYHTARLSRFKPKPAYVTYHNPIYDQRYADNWKQIKAYGWKIVGGRCCYPGCRYAGKEWHHAAYRDSLGALAGREIPGEHVFLLCKKHHHGFRRQDGAHHPDNWCKGIEPPPSLDACQRPWYFQLLVEGWNEKASKVGCEKPPRQVTR